MKKRMKKLNPILLILLIVVQLAVLAGLGIGIYFLTTDLELSFKKEDPVFLIGETRDPMDFVGDTNGEVTVEPAAFDTSTIGDREVVFTVKKDIRTKEFRFPYSVEEHEKPRVLRNGNGTVLQRGTKFNINDVISYGDNADPTPKLKLKGEIDMKKNGIYPLHATVTDACGNKKEWDFSVEVAEEVPEVVDDRERQTFEDFVKMHQGKGRTFGIDVSVWQDDIDFQKVKDAGCEFVIIRIGYSEGGEVTEDRLFEQNLKRAKDAGLQIGVYLYCEDASKEDVLSSADWVLEKLHGQPLDLPIAFDWESFDSFQTSQIDFGTLNSLYDVFAERVEEQGYNCMLYGSKIMLEDIWEDLNTRTVWLAHFSEHTDYKWPKLMWQASDTGRIDGIAGDVDMDILYQ